MQVFSYEFCVTFKNFFYRKPTVTGSDVKTCQKSQKNQKNPWNIQISIVFSVFVDAEHNC